MADPVFSVLADVEWFEHRVDISTLISRPATDKDRAAWPEEYRAFKVAQLPPLADKSAPTPKTKRRGK